MFRILRSPEGDGGTGAGAVTFTPEQQKVMDHAIQERLARQKQQYGDYDTMKERLAKIDQENEQKNQKDLEERKQWDTLKQGYEGRLKKADEEIGNTRKENENLRKTHALSNEISKQNGYIEESIALLSGNTILKDGKVFIKGVDTSDAEKELPLEEGIKLFLKARPHLVKASSKGGGGGTPPGGGSGSGAGTGAEDQTALNRELADAIKSGDKKKAGEIKIKLRAMLKTSNSNAVLQK